MREMGNITPCISAGYEPGACFTNAICERCSHEDGKRPWGPVSQMITTRGLRLHSQGLLDANTSIASVVWISQTYWNWQIISRLQIPGRVGANPLETDLVDNGTLTPRSTQLSLQKTI